MSIYIELLLVAVTVIYIVDLSGWTDTWLGWLSRFTTRRGFPPVRQLRPFSCSQCMVWWCCLAWAIIRHHLSLPTVAAAAGFAFFSLTINQFLLFIRESIMHVLMLFERWTTRKDY